MKSKQLTDRLVRKFQNYLVEQERSLYTIEKYLRDIEKLREFVGKRRITKELMIAYKDGLVDSDYAVSSVNSMLASVNSLFTFLSWKDLHVKMLDVQNKGYCGEHEEILKKEYERLLAMAEKGSRLYMILQTLCSTGIRISELSYFTVEAIEKGEVVVTCKKKTRVILIPGKLKKMLLDYCRRKGIESGVIFRTRSGKPVDRSNVWREMKKLGEKAGIAPSKVFPHNLRKLFARTFYKKEKDIARLADLLGHSRIETTRIYIMDTTKENRRAIERLGLVV